MAAPQHPRRCVAAHSRHLFVMPVIGFILWQLTGWLSMLTSIAGRLIVLPILICWRSSSSRIVVALFKR